MRFTHLAFASALALSTFSMAPAAYAQQHQTQLSQCMRNGLIGAGVGGLVGALSSRHHRGQRAVIGAAVGGVGTWGICRILSNREQHRVENGYQQALDNNHSYNENWHSDDGARSLHVDRPQRTNEYGANCRRVTATVSDPNNGVQDLPPETYCRTSSGSWVPA